MLATQGPFEASTERRDAAIVALRSKIKEFASRLSRRAPVPGAPMLRKNTRMWGAPAAAPDADDEEEEDLEEGDTAEAK